jgi:hypothetical protein
MTDVLLDYLKHICPDLTWSRKSSDSIEGATTIGNNWLMPVCQIHHDQQQVHIGPDLDRKTHTVFLGSPDLQAELSAAITASRFPVPGTIESAGKVLTNFRRFTP